MAIATTELKIKKKKHALETINSDKMTKYVKLSTVLKECTTLSAKTIHTKMRRDDYAVQLEELKKLFESLGETV